MIMTFQSRLRNVLFAVLKTCAISKHITLGIPNHLVSVFLTRQMTWDKRLPLNNPNIQIPTAGITRGSFSSSPQRCPWGNQDDEAPHLWSPQDDNPHLVHSPLGAPTSVECTRYVPPCADRSHSPPHVTYCRLCKFHAVGARARSITR